MPIVCIWQVWSIHAYVGCPRHQSIQKNPASTKISISSHVRHGTAFHTNPWFGLLKKVDKKKNCETNVGESTTSAQFSSCAIYIEPKNPNRQKYQLQKSQCKISTTKIPYIKSGFKK